MLLVVKPQVLEAVGCHHSVMSARKRHLRGVKCLTGCLEGLEHTAELVAKQRQTFTEQTQEDLYMSTHAGKSASKKGLGSSTAPSAPRHPPLVPACLPIIWAGLDWPVQ